jgi:hypothetical protein
MNNIDNIMNTTKFTNLNSICSQIEAMTQNNQIEVLRILSKHKDIILNENKNGIYINLTEIENTVINELSSYIQYINEQESNLNVMELQKQQFKNIYFSKDNKDKTGKCSNNYESSS